MARQVALGTNAFPSLLRRVRPYVVPVYDYALMTEPLRDSQLAEIGWRNRQGIGDSANQFHYYRLTADNRILFGGYDAVYHFGKKISPSLDHRAETFDLLADHFAETFPQLDGLGFTHAWGGVIDVCSRFCAFFGTAHGGQTAYATGYTGLGVGRDAVRCRRDARPAGGGGDRAHRDRAGAVEADCRSRPSRSRMPESSSPARHSRRPTSTRGDATSGCARSTGSDSASTPEPGDRSSAVRSRDGPRSHRRHFKL